MVLLCLIALAMLAAPSLSFARAKHDATLIHVGPSGLESYDAWTKKTVTLVHGMVGTWYCPEISPHGLSAVTIISGRTDRARTTNMYGAVISPTAVPFEITFPDESGWVQMSMFSGWLDDYTAVFQQTDPDSGTFVTIARDTRTGSWSYYGGTVTYPAGRRKRTKADSTYSIAVSRKQILTVRVRKTKRQVARFKVPGAGNGTSPTGWFYLDSSISPDGKFISYELWRYALPGANYGFWRTYVCTLGGGSARRLKNDNGGFVWR